MLELRNVNTNRYPWRHVHFGQFFTEGTVEKILELWPTEGWRELIHPDQLKDDGTYRRKQLALEDIGGEFWNSLLAELTAPALAEFIASKTGAQRDEKTYCYPLLVDDEPGYWIRRHHDTTQKLITCAIYIDGHRGEGTRFCAGDDDVLHISFYPNTGYAFHVEPHTNHFVPVGICTHRRRQLQLLYYREKDFAYKGINYAQPV